MKRLAAASLAIPIATLLFAAAPAQADDGLQAALKAAVDPIAAHLLDADAKVRLAAVRDLGRLGPAAASAAPALVKVMKEPDLGEAACQALGRIGPAALPALRKGINDGDPYFRIYVLRAIWQFAEGLTPDAALLRELRQQLDPDQPPPLRIAAAMLIVRLGSRAAETGEALVATLSKPGEGLDEPVVTALAAVGKAAVPALLAGLRDDRPAVLMGVAEAIGRIGPDAADAAPRLIGWLSDKDWRRRMAAAKALGGLGAAAGPAVPRLIEIAWSQDPPEAPTGETGPEVLGPLYAHQAAERALIRLGPAAAPALDLVIEQLDKPMGTRRVAAVETLRAMGPAAAPATDRLFKLLRDRAWPVPGLVVATLAAIGPTTAPPAVKLLDDPDPLLAGAGAQLLGMLGAKAASTSVSPLVRHLTNDYPPALRSACLDALELLGSSAEPATMMLAGIVASESAAGPRYQADADRMMAAADQLRAQAAGEKDPARRAETEKLIAKTLERYAELDARRQASAGLSSKSFAVLVAIGPAAVKPLVTMLSDDNRLVRREASAALGRIGPAASVAVPALVKALGDKERLVRMAAGLSLARIGTPAVQPLIEALGSPDSEVRYGACEALAQIGGPPADAAARPLLACCDDKDIYVQAAAVAALADLSPQVISGSPFIAKVEAKLASDQPKPVRMAAATALGCLPGATAGRVRRLAGLMDDASLRDAAIDGLYELGRRANVK
ncbi:MAG: hypothetical protein BIFFINMI_01459 [Phycisphaerae bacterium]|nr:hypothetical protein [Phycisphaerae bacterium]